MPDPLISTPPTTDPADAAPAFGEPTPQPPASPEAVARLARRRSASALTLAAPGPDAAQLKTLLTLAARAPDHGKLSPWRFLVIEGEAKAALADRLATLAAGRPDAAKATATLAKLRNPPLCVAVISALVTPSQIPEWEQVLSAGAVCMNLLSAAGALGFGANWLTDWYSYDARARPALGLAEGERVAGFVMIGAAEEIPTERARSDIENLVTWLRR